MEISKRSSLGAAWAVLAVTVALVVSGCAGSHTRTGWSPNVGLERATGFRADAWNGLLHQHEDRLVACMHRAGFEFWSTASWAYLTLNPHGLFGRPTPAAEEDYLRRYGYGVAQRVSVLRTELAAARRPTNEMYVESLDARRRTAYARALFGDDGRSGCAQAGTDPVLRLDLPDGGALGEAFGDALAEARETDGYQRWEGRVVACLSRHDVEVPERRLGRVKEQFLVDLLDLAGSRWSRTEHGIRYDLTTRQAAGVSRQDLRALRRRELAAARLEIGCRHRAGNAAQEAVDQASASLAVKYRTDVATLREALRRTEEKGERG